MEEQPTTPFIGCLRAVSMRDTLSLNNAREPPSPQRAHRLLSETCGRPTTRAPKRGTTKAWKGVGRGVEGQKPLRFDRGDWNEHPPMTELLPPHFDREERRKGIRRARRRKNCGGSYLHRPAINLIYTLLCVEKRTNEFRSGEGMFE